MFKDEDKNYIYLTRDFNKILSDNAIKKFNGKK
jgi:hypothetical protein